MVVADEEGVVVVPGARQEEALRAARAELAKEAGESLAGWEQAHRARIDAILAENGCTD
jgi:regulator of RNase E activity RraA